MRLDRKVLAGVAAGLLTVSAVPALALENEFHGMFQGQFISSNFNGSSTTAGIYDPSGLDKKSPSANFFEQRARLMYIAKANDNVKLVTHFELDYSHWGDASYTVRRNVGSALGGDTVNLETKNVYLDFNLPLGKTPINMKVGLQGNTDSLKGIYFDADMAGIMASASYDKFTNSLGFFRLKDDRNNNFGMTTPYGTNTWDLFMLDSKYELSKDAKLGFTYYLSHDDGAMNGANYLTSINRATINTLGLNGEANLGPVTLSGFVAYQFGKDTFESNVFGVPQGQSLSAWAANLGAKAKLGPGTLRGEFLYASGEKNRGWGGTNNAFQVIADEQGYYANEMVLIGRDKYAMTTDNAVIYTVNNFDQGVIMGAIGYDMPLSDRLMLHANLGFAAVAVDQGNSNGFDPRYWNSAKPLNGLSGVANDSNYLGTEVNMEANYKLYENLTATVRGAYLALGDYYKGVALAGQDPDNPYDVRVILNYTF